METITNAATTVVNTASNLIYGQPAKDSETNASSTTTGNETGGKEPVSGLQGKGTVNEPFDQGNAETPLESSSKDTTSVAGNISSKEDDFLKLSPALGKPSATESSTGTTTGTTSDTAMPIIPLNPDVATSGAGKTDATSSATETGVSEKVWKPTALDEVKTEAAPGAGPSAPAFTPATPDLSSSTSPKASDSSAPTVKDSSSEPPKKESVGGDIDAILGSTPKSKHTIDDAEANDPHSKMSGKTVRQTEASHHGETDGSKSLASEKIGTSNTSTGATSPTSDEKSGKKMSALKDKLKDKLHIGSKDK